MLIRCPKCDGEVSSPTAAQDLLYGWSCIYCKEHITYPIYTIEQWIADIDERLRELEASK